jgi:hypothetical protein
MSGELKPTGSFTVGQEVLARPKYGKDPELVKAVVTKVARIWAEAAVEGWHSVARFRVATGEPDPKSQHQIVLPEVRAYSERIGAAHTVLKAHGFEASWRVHDAELFAVADLLEKGV